MTEQVKDNVYILTFDDFEPSKLLEYKKIYTITALIEERMGRDSFSSILFVFLYTGVNLKLREDVALNFDTCTFNKKVLIWIGEENGRIPSQKIFDKYDIVFKTHLREEDEERKLYGLPLITPEEILNMPIVPFRERYTNILFVGNLNNRRVPFMYSLSGLHYIGSFIKPLITSRVGYRLFPYLYGNKKFDLSHLFPNSVIRFTNGFNTGLPRDEYMNLTEHSKIILSPSGFWGPECFRLYEALSRGCVVITEKLPKVSYYKDIPVVQVETWKNVAKITKDLLNQPKQLEEMSKKSKDFYFSYLSTESITRFICDRLNSVWYPDLG